MYRIGVLLASLTVFFGASSNAIAGMIYADTLSENTTGAADSIFLGPPDLTSFALGNAEVTYDFSGPSVLNGNGADFHVYEGAAGTPEFETIDVLVSVDGFTFTSVKASESAVRLDEIAKVLGPPDTINLAIGSGGVIYDYGGLSVIDGAGADFNVYEDAAGSPEFEFIDVLVSADGVNFISVKATESEVIRIPGDEGLSNDSFGRSYDLSSSGLNAVRFIQIDGTFPLPPGGNNGFELDAIGAINTPNPSIDPFPDTLSENTVGLPFVRAYDLDIFGIDTVQFIQIDGIFPAPPGGINGFELDAIGVVARVPSPATYWLFGIGLAGLGLSRREHA